MTALRSLFGTTHPAPSSNAELRTPLLEQRVDIFENPAPRTIHFTTQNQPTLSPCQPKKIVFIVEKISGEVGYAAGVSYCAIALTGGAMPVFLPYTIAAGLGTWAFLRIGEKIVERMQKPN